MKKYQMRNSEKEIKNTDEINEIIRTQKYVTLAMCKDGEPYLVTVNHAYDENENCIYFHCARVGKKIDFLKANPIVWGQVLEDSGYIQGKCSHVYRTIHFRGEVRFLEDLEEKRKALGVLIEGLEMDPEPLKKKFINNHNLEKVAMGKVMIQEIWGKKSTSQSWEDVHY
ncbi:MAG: hypothetical protein E3J78_03970 [Candidatus Cloacimonadota bacterium]|nr:MAG: hypothetical protein E3J78_03970 [Candidatus Cloacimonadota bacterium]